MRLPDSAGWREGVFCWHDNPLGRDEMMLWDGATGCQLRVKTGSALVEHKISASPPKPDICALMSTRISYRLIYGDDEDYGG
jgi:hypothetical protein